MEIFDISQTLSLGVAVWPGDRNFHSEWTMRIRDGDACNVSAVSMSTHTGTHLDAPYHFDESGDDIGTLRLRPFLGPARVVEMRVEQCIAAQDLERIDIRGVERILFKTRASRLPEQESDPHFVYLSEEGAEYLGRLGVLLVATDAPSIDAFESRTFAAHKLLLKHRIAILEGTRLGNVSPGDYELICLPLRLAGLDASPVRAILRR